MNEQHADGGALVAAAGSLEFLRYSVVKPDEENIPRYTDIIEETGAIEITGLQGHLGRESDGSATSHLHGTFALGDGTVRAGHVYDARVLVTVEMTVLLSDGLAWKRSVVEYGAGKTMPVLLPMQSIRAPGLSNAAQAQQAV
ncbi:putative DNA-binding protein with PD1-like motif [Paenarthrobacter nitroguajacolicus]|nr:putative DNA-binding protein with PD1-like motif [Paenarthrobacter nitroguajacolicus]